jgi:hypothetical protein
MAKQVLLSALQLNGSFKKKKKQTKLQLNGKKGPSLYKIEHKTATEEQKRDYL